MKGFFLCLAILIFTGCAKDVAEFQIDHNIKKFGVVEKRFHECRISERVNEKGVYTDFKIDKKGYLRVDFEKGEITEKSARQIEPVTTPMSNIRQGHIQSLVHADMPDGSTFSFRLLKVGEKWILRNAQNDRDFKDEEGFFDKTIFVLFQ